MPRANDGRTIRSALGETSISSPTEAPIEPETVALALSQVALDQKAAEVAILDMRSLVDYTDLFVLCTARNRRHVAAVAEALRLHAKKSFEVASISVEGLPSARWVLLDFGPVIVHVFDDPMRGFYNLDGLWSDAPRLPVPESAGETASGGGEDEDDEALDLGGSEFELGR